MGIIRDIMRMEIEKLKIQSDDAIIEYLSGNSNEHDSVLETINFFRALELECSTQQEAGLLFPDSLKREVIMTDDLTERIETFLKSTYREACSSINERGYYSVITQISRLKYYKIK